MSAVFSFLKSLESEIESITGERKQHLDRLVQYLVHRIHHDGEAAIMYVCIHNSRRSHFGQAWGLAAAVYCKVFNVYTYSGGTEATAIHPNTLAALKRAGWNIHQLTEDNNPLYYGRISVYTPPVIFFSKTIEHGINPKSGFAAYMTCGEAEENCPFVPGAELRVSLPYEDPKKSDGTAFVNETYDARCRQIALENLYVFSEVKQRI